MKKNPRCDVLLINPPWISKDENIWHGIKSAMPPLGLLSIASFVESKGFNTRVIDVHVEKYTTREVFDLIQEASPRIIGLSVMTATSNAAHLIAKIAKKALPNCTVVFGGVHAEALPAECLCNSSVDYVVRGDGEETFLEICQGKPHTSINGLSYRDQNQIIHTPARKVEMNLDQYPMPAYHLIDMDKYYPAIGAYKRLPAINMLMTRGCPGKCTFCNSAMTALRTRDARKVVDEIKYLKKTYGIREIQFYDDTFTVMKKNVIKFCELLIEEKVGITWAAFVRADCFSEDLAFLMKKAGCHQVLIGVESGDDEILKNIRKPIDRERIRETIEIARRAGIDSRAAFIFGNQGETVQSMQNTLDYSMELDPDIALYNICTPYPGTQLFKWAKEHGYLVSEEWSDFELSTFMMRLPTVTEAQINAFYKHAHKTFFMRPKKMFERLLRVTSPSQLLDLVNAFFFIVLRRKLGTRGEVRKGWTHYIKTDFFDLEALEEQVHLTHEIRQNQSRGRAEILKPAQNKNQLEFVEAV